MESAAYQISDSTILSLIRKNNLKGWGQFYNRYAPIMYGVICTLTADTGISEKTFTNIFIRLK